MNIPNTECSLVCLSFLLLGPPFKKGARKQIKMRIVRWFLGKEGSDRLGFFISEERWLWEAMMETNKVIDSVFINCRSLVISVKHKSYSLKLANECTQWKNRLKIKQRNYFLFHPHTKLLMLGHPLCCYFPLYLHDFFLFIFYIAFHILSLLTNSSLYPGLWSSSPTCMLPYQLDCLSGYCFTSHSTSHYISTKIPASHALLKNAVEIFNGPTLGLPHFATDIS